MNNKQRVTLCAYWRERCVTASEYIAQCFDFLARLREFSSAFDHMCVAVDEGPEVLSEVVPKGSKAFEELMFKAVPYREHAYTNPDSTNKGFTLESTIPAGFTVTFSDAGQGDTKPSGLAVTITAGAYGGEYSPTNLVLIEIPTDYRLFWEDRERAKQLIELIVSIWKPAFAGFTSNELRKALDPQRVNNFPFGPLMYFSEAEVAALVNGPTASVEFLADGGVFLSVDAEYPWVASIDRFRPCYARLSEAGLLRWAHRRQPRAS